MNALQAAGVLAAMTLPLVSVPGCDDGDEPEPEPEVTCPTKHIVSTNTESLGTTSTCGPEPVSQQVDITTSGTVITVGYHDMLLVCGGTVNVVLSQNGNELTLDEHVDVGSTCGCYNEWMITVELDVCEPGTYTIITNGISQDVTL